MEKAISVMGGGGKIDKHQDGQGEEWTKDMFVLVLVNQSTLTRKSSCVNARGTPPPA